MKIHLVRSDLPLVAGVDQKADCGKVIARVAFPFIADGCYDDAIMANPLRVCTKCACGVRVGAARYVYGLVAGQEAMVEA